MRKNLNNVIGTFFFFVIFLLADTVYAQAGVTDDYPIVKLRSLDKITAHNETFEAKVGSTVKFGPLFIKVQACRKSPPIELPEAAAFLQIWEVSPEDKASWVFSGWMFASSPGLSSMDHPIYDVWVLDCLGDKIEREEDAGENPEGEAGDEAAAGTEGEIIREDLSPENTEAAPQ